MATRTKSHTTNATLSRGHVVCEDRRVIDTAVFSWIQVDNLIRGSTTVQWELDVNMHDPGPYEFQLQVGRTANPRADDWTNVGSPVIDAFMAVDPNQRDYGKELTVHYRIRLKTMVGTYLSRPYPATSHMSRMQRVLAQEILRKEMVRQRIYLNNEGFLLKRRRWGPVCVVCTDPRTREIVKTNCEDCYGTGIDKGYFEPVPCQFADLGLASYKEGIDIDSGRGYSRQSRITGRFIGTPQISHLDLWVNAHTDERFFIDDVKEEARVGNFPLVLSANLKLAPFNDIVYQIPVS